MPAEKGKGAMADVKLSVKKNNFIVQSPRSPTNGPAGQRKDTATKNVGTRGNTARDKKYSVKPTAAASAQEADAAAIQEQPRQPKKYARQGNSNLMNYQQPPEEKMVKLPQSSPEDADMESEAYQSVAKPNEGDIDDDSDPVEDIL